MCSSGQWIVRTIENRLSVDRDLRALIDAIEHDLEK